MPTKKPFLKQYPVGTKVWHIVSRAKGAWRVGVVIAQSVTNYGWDSITVVQPGTKTKRIIYDQHNSEVFLYDLMPYVPNGTTYLIDTMIGHTLSHRLGPYWDTLFEVYECGNRLITKGTHFGYIIIPGCISNCVTQKDNPAYKFWHVAPNVQELLVFLGAKLPEILAVNKQLNPKEKNDVNTDSEV